MCNVIYIYYHIACICVTKFVLWCMPRHVKYMILILLCLIANQNTNTVLRAYVNLKLTNSNLCDSKKILMYYDFVADELDVTPPILPVSPIIWCFREEYTQ